MSQSRQASSQVAWTLLMEGAAAARIESHRLRHLLNRALKLVDESDRRDHLFQVAGDVILDFPKRLDRLDVVLDRTLLGLTEMGQEFLQARLPLDDRTRVNDALEGAAQVHSARPPTNAMARRVASRWLAHAGPR